MRTYIAIILEAISDFFGFLDDTEKRRKESKILTVADRIWILITRKLLNIITYTMKKIYLVE